MGSADPPSRLEHGDGARGVHLVAADRIGQRPGHRRAGGQVDDGVGPGQGGVEGGDIEDRAFDQGRLDAVEVGGRAARQVVDGDHLVDLGGGDQRPAQVGADEPGAAGDHHLHVLDPPVAWTLPLPTDGCAVAYRPS